MFGNFGAMKAAAMVRRNNNQQPQQGGIGNALSAVQRGMSSMGMGATINSQPQQGGMGSMVSNAINNVRASRENRGTIPGGASIPGGPGGMFAKIMRGRNVANQNQLTSTAINPNAFNTGTVGQVFQSSPTNGYVDPILSQTQANPNWTGTPLTQKKSSPLKQDMNNSVDPLTGQPIDPTMSQDLNPGTVDPMLDQDLTSSPQY